MILRRCLVAVAFAAAYGCSSPSAPDCTYRLRAPASRAFTFGPAGGAGVISIATPSTCRWYVEENALAEDWIRVSSATRSGSMDVTFTVDAASLLPQLPLPRTGTINVWDGQNQNTKHFTIIVTQQ